MVSPVSASSSFGQSLGQAAASAAATGASSGLFGQIFAGANARRQWRYQQKQMALQQKYALEQMQKQSELSYANWQKQFDYENDYNNPSKVFERYLAAGVTPAAVLGSSGVGVNATVSGGSAPMPSASGPSGGSGAIGAGGFAPVDPASIAQNMVAKSTIDRNDAASNRDNAEADLMRGNTHTVEWRTDIDELDKQVREHDVNNAAALADLNRALADIHTADADYAELMATYKFQDFVAQYGKHVEEYNQIKKYNSKFFDQVYAAQIARDYAAAYNSAAAGDLSKAEIDIAKVRLSDLREWFRINWEAEIDVPDVNEHGKPTGKNIKMTGRQIHERLAGLAAAGGEQGLSAQWFSNRSEKNAFGYSMARTALAGAMAIGGMALTKGMSAPAAYEETREHYSPDGEFIGGTHVSRRNLRK